MKQEPGDAGEKGGEISSAIHNSGKSEGLRSGCERRREHWRGRAGSVSCPLIRVDRKHRPCLGVRV